MGLGKVHLLGHSYGGSLALNAIDRYPQSFRSAIFASAPIGDAEVLEREFRRLARSLPPKVRRWWTRPNPKLADMWNPSSRRGFREYSKGYESFSRLRVCRLRTMPHELAQSMQSLNLKVAAGIRASLRGRSADSAKALRRLRLPCLVTAGRYDQIPVRVARNIHELVPRSRLEIFERSAHLPHFEERDRYIDVLRNFLDAVR